MLRSVNCVERAQQSMTCLPELALGVLPRWCLCPKISARVSHTIPLVEEPQVQRHSDIGSTLNTVERFYGRPWLITTHDGSSHDLRNVSPSKSKDLTSTKTLLAKRLCKGHQIVGIEINGLACISAKQALGLPSFFASLPSARHSRNRDRSKGSTGGLTSSRPPTTTEKLKGERSCHSPHTTDTDPRLRGLKCLGEAS